MVDVDGAVWWVTVSCTVLLTICVSSSPTGALTESIVMVNSLSEDTTDAVVSPPFITVVDHGVIGTSVKRGRSDYINMSLGDGEILT